MNGHSRVGASCSQPLNYLDIRQHIQFETAEPAGNAHSKQPVTPHIAPVLERMGGLGVVSGGARSQTLTGKPSCGGHQPIGVSQHGAVGYSPVNGQNPQSPGSFESKRSPTWEGKTAVPLYVPGYVRRNKVWRRLVV